jgi:ABC-type transport system involved in multi-copper enzyme maturation permease subunit
MTALSTMSPPALVEEGANLQPLPWRRMAWVIWRQHRTALIGVFAFIGALAVCLLVVGLQLHHAYTAATACHPAGSAACNTLVANFNGIGNFLSNGILFQVVPPLIGAFVGAPVLARELETGTFRYAWTQGIGRWRWTLAKLVALGFVVTAASGALSTLASWYYQPYFASGNQSLSLTKFNPLNPGSFDQRGFAFAAWTLAAFAIGALAGALIRRVVPAIVTTLAVCGALAFATGGWLRMHYLTPLVTKGLNVPGSVRIVSQWGSRGGRVVFTGPPTFPIYQQYCPAQAGLGKGGGGPSSGNPLQCLAQHGFTFWTSYQPASRFWAFQWIEGGWLLALSVLVIAATVLLVRRRAT